ncbi:hypothetical protein ACOSP7_001808 [Xanthoceras sorbifolium]
MVASLGTLMIIFTAFWIPGGHADARTDVVSRSCGKVNATSPEIARQRYSSMLQKMKGEMCGDRKFAISESGEVPDKVYMLSQCMDDLSNNECEACFTQVYQLLQHCLPANGGRVYLDGCFARFENYNFFKEVKGPADSRRCGSDVETDKGFKELVEQVVMKMVVKAPANNGFAEEEDNANGLSAYGIASCWKTLDNQSCSTCLDHAASSSLSCLPSIEGRALNAGCYLRYSYYEFSNSKGSKKEKSGNYHALLYCSYVIYGFAVCVLAIWVGFYLGKITYRRKLRRTMQKGVEVDLSSLHGALQFLQFKYSTIDRATESFCEANKLGRGGYGEVFKGTLQDGREIAIKRLFLSRKNQIKEICNEMDIISRAQHKNLVRFLGCCFTHADSFFVYEYLANKSLDRILFDLEEKKKLDWKTRLRIIMGTAEGLEYLHNRCQVRIIHRDIKASNILLDLKHKPKIADFGLAKFCSSDKSTMNNTGIAGTLGYMAPEYIAKGRLTDKVDVYSFGVLVLEIVSGVQNNKFQSENSFETLVVNTWKHFQAYTVSEIIDNSMEKSPENMEEMKRVVWVGLLCTQESASHRPTMKNVVEMLKHKDMKLPIPSKPPFTDECMELSGSFHRRQHSSDSYKN